MGSCHPKTQTKNLLIFYPYPNTTYDFSEQQSNCKHSNEYLKRLSERVTTTMRQLDPKTATTELPNIFFLIL